MTPKRMLPPDHPDAPKFWRAETSGLLAMAVEQYLRAPSAMTQADRDDSVRTFAPNFPWFDLGTKVAMKADEAGIEFRATGVATGVAQEEVAAEVSPAQ